MISRGITIKECPSKQFKGKIAENSDNDEIPDPELDDDKESYDEAHLRDKHETQSDSEIHVRAKSAMDKKHGLPQVAMPLFTKKQSHQSIKLLKSQ